MSTPPKPDYKELLFTPDSIHCSLDLETLSLEPTAHIIQIGAVMWKGVQDLGTFDIKIDPLDNKGRHVSPDTMKWWDAQDLKLRERVFSGTSTLQHALSEFESWCVDLSDFSPEDINFWCRGPEFDIPILQSAYEMFGPYPFNFRRVHSTRTACAIFSEEVYEYFEKLPRKKHDALDDALYQAKCVKCFLAVFGLY